MSTVATFSVKGEPKGQPRPRVGKGGHVYDPGTAGTVKVKDGQVVGGKGWKLAIALEAAKHKPAEVISGPVSVFMSFRMPRPKRMIRKRPHPEDGRQPHTSTPDIDNLAKAALDVLTQLGFWKDDSQVVQLEALKMYHADKVGVPGVSVYLDWGKAHG